MQSAGKKELNWGAATRPLPGETECGDCHFVEQTATGWLLAVADGLGHGPEAAFAGAIFLDVLIRHKDETPENLIRLSHDALKNTRGIACTIVTINSRQNLLSWIAVGNVEGIVRHCNPAASSIEYVTLRGGIVGYRLPELQTSHLRLIDGDTLAIATDGIDSDFVSTVSAVQPPDVLADRILEHYAKPADDALILIARWQTQHDME
jgi:phosphoserine phosphatase RsbX